MSKRYFLYLVFLWLLFFSCNQSGEKRQSTATDTTNVQFRLAKLNELIVEQPQKAELYYKRAALQMERGLFPAAVADARLASQFDSLNASYYLFLADVAFRALMVKESVDAFKRCLELAPSNLEANLKYAELNLYLKAYPDALKYANDALRIDEKQVRAYFVKGFVYKETGDTAKAVSSFQTAVEVDPENYDAYIQLGNLFSARGNGIALQYYNNALRLRPASTEALYDRGLFLQDAGKFELAENDYRTILKIDPKYADAHYNIGYIRLVYQHKPDESITFFTDAIRVSPEYVEAFYNRGMAYKLNGDKESARKDFLKVLSLSPDYKMAKDRLKELGLR